MRRILVYLITFLTFFQSCQLNQNIAYNIPDPDCTGVFYLCTDVDKERLGRQAIKAIHEQMDDDKDGLIEASESRDFIKEELQSKTDSIRHRRFQNADLQITFNDLWTQWQANPVYNWTNDDIIYWLVNHVHLPMYVENFRRNQFDGRMIPRLAANEKHYLSAIMQVRDPRHKRRLIIKATDGVLFGPPENTHNLVKDIILMSAVLISFGACLYAFVRHRKTQDSMKVMLKELETLQKAEGDLISVTGKMKVMEHEMKDKTKVDRGLLNSWFSEIQRTKDEAERFRKHRGSTMDHEKQLRLALQEIEQLHIALRKAEEHAQHQSYEPPSELIDLLKRTYYIEEAAFEIKRKAAEIALLQAKEQMNKITKMQRGFFGAVRIAHTDCIDNISELINAAKGRLSDVHDEYEEREKRWNRVASLLEREDLVSNSSSSSISVGSPSYLPGNTNVSLNNGNASNLSADSSRLKQISIDSSNSILNTYNDSSLSNKTNSNVNNRGLPINPLSPTQIFQQDNLNSNDNTSIYSTTSSGGLRRRALTNNGLSSDRLVNNSTLIYSNSTTGLNGSNGNLREMVGDNTYDSLDLPSLAKQSKPMFEIASDSQFDNNDSPSYDQQQNVDQRSQMFDSIYDDRLSSSSSSDKGRKSTLSSKLLKPFQIIRHRKKSAGT